jgi:hypothetical protein
VLLLLFGLGVLNPWTGGIRPFSTIMTALIIAAIPLAASECPMFGFTAPIRSGGESGSRSQFIARESASTSIGSPTGVPVPWHSKKPQRSGFRPPPCLCASRITRS